MKSNISLFFVFLFFINTWYGCEESKDSQADQIENSAEDISVTNQEQSTSQNETNENAEEVLELSQIEFLETVHDFGKVSEGDVVEHDFVFKNVGTAPLIVEKVKPSCGCTTPDWTKDPVPVGGQGFVKVSFNSKGKKGNQNKSVTVTSNTEPAINQLKFKAEVVKE